MHTKIVRIVRLGSQVDYPDSIDYPDYADYTDHPDPLIVLFPLLISPDTATL